MAKRVTAGKYKWLPASDAPLLAAIAAYHAVESNPRLVRGSSLPIAVRRTLAAHDAIAPGLEGRPANAKLQAVESRLDHHLGFAKPSKSAADGRGSRVREIYASTSGCEQRGFEVFIFTDIAPPPRRRQAQGGAG